MDNIWKTIPIAPNYLISNNGKVKNKISGEILKLRYDKDGYLKVQLSTPLKKQKNFFVHRNVNYSNIFACLKGRLKTTGGYIFEEGV